jgi:hypothetical protein
MHFAIHFQPGRLLAQQFQRLAHLDGTGLVAAAKVGVRQQRGLGLDAKAHHFFGRHDGDFGQLLGVGS